MSNYVEKMLITFKMHGDSEMAIFQIETSSVSRRGVVATVTIFGLLKLYICRMSKCKAIFILVLLVILQVIFNCP